MPGSEPLVCFGAFGVNEPATSQMWWSALLHRPSDNLHRIKVIMNTLKTFLIFAIKLEMPKAEACVWKQIWTVYAQIS